MLIPTRRSFDRALQVPMVGASGGGLAAVLAACEVAPEDVLESAYALSLEHGIWDRPLGLVGTWGELIQQWLHDLLVSSSSGRRGECQQHAHSLTASHHHALAPVAHALPVPCFSPLLPAPPTPSRPTRRSAATARWASW